jgi:hypothetical protein
MIFSDKLRKKNLYDLLDPRSFVDMKLRRNILRTPGRNQTLAFQPVAVYFTV